MSLGTLFSTRQNNLNLLRLIAALCVIYGHAGAITGGGEPDVFLRLVGYKFIGGVAVDVFFVLSGFLIASSLCSGKGIIYYMISRVLRIFPALLVCVLLTAMVLGPWLTVSDQYWTEATWNYVLHNGLAWKTEYFLPGVFSDLHDKAVNGSLWSLPVEVRLYVWALALYCLQLLRHRVLFNLVMIGLFALGIFKPSVYAPFLIHPSHLQTVGMFMIGMLCWVNRKSIPLHPLVFCAVLGVVAMAKGTAFFGYVYMVAVPYTVFCLAFVPGFGWFNRVGDFSYGAYLYGWPIQQLMMTADRSMSTAENAVLSCVAALVVGAISWHMVEAPALRLKHLFSRNPTAKFAPMEISS
jgi:peptidoglycan/LPS O-acetylase OafA/YrhL